MFILILMCLLEANVHIRSCRIDIVTEAKNGKRAESTRQKKAVCFHRA